MSDRGRTFGLLFVRRSSTRVRFILAEDRPLRAAQAWRNAAIPFDRAKPHAGRGENAQGESKSGIVEAGQAGDAIGVERPPKLSTAIQPDPTARTDPNIFRAVLMADMCSSRHGRVAREP